MSKETLGEGAIAMAMAIARALSDGDSESTIAGQERPDGAIGLISVDGDSQYYQCGARARERGGGAGARARQSESEGMARARARTARRSPKGAKKWRRGGYLEENAKKIWSCQKLFVILQQKG